MMASTNRGQPATSPANQCGAPRVWVLKGGHISPPCCCCDVMPSKPGLLGRGMIEAKQPTCSPTCNVTKCASKRCMTCKHLVLGSGFSSNLTNKNSI